MIEFDEDDPRYLVEKGLIREEVIKQVLSLREYEAEVILHRFWNGFTLKETGLLFGVTQERIRQLELKALRKLRHPKRADPLMLMLENLTREEYEDILLKRRKEAALIQKQEREEEDRKWEERLDKLNLEREKHTRLRYRENELYRKRIAEQQNKKRTYSERVPDMLTLDIDEKGMLYIRCPEWTTFNIPMDVYQSWLKQLIEKGD